MRVMQSGVCVDDLEQEELRDSHGKTHKSRLQCSAQVGRPQQHAGRRLDVVQEEKVVVQMVAKM